MANRVRCVYAHLRTLGRVRRRAAGPHPGRRPDCRLSSARLYAENLAVKFGSTRCLLKGSRRRVYGTDVGLGLAPSADEKRIHTRFRDDCSRMGL